MKLFHTSELHSKPFNDLTIGHCFYDTTARAWTIVFALANSEDKGQKFLVPLSGANSLVATPWRPDAGNCGVKRVLTFDLKGSFGIRLDSEPMENQGAHSASKPLLVLKNGPAIYSQVMRNPSVPVQRDGFLLNLDSFHCEFANEFREMDISDATVIEHWSLVLNAAPNLGKVFFQQSSTQHTREVAA